ncbi:MAG: YvcK family protein [Proteobacteria bacterium]|nr:YvcK family protein [Pseudomonadota bacterium]MBU1688337.1 YvcK family protein [Pseudomonadota bacterium]
MVTEKTSGNFTDLLSRVRDERFGPFDLLPRGELVEKVIELALSGSPVGAGEVATGLMRLTRELQGIDTSNLRVVVFGGGSGLSNLVGGDSRRSTWPEAPFHGLKELFPKTRSVVCITDDGGSTGELLKDLDLVAVGDLRHVLLSSVTLANLQFRYSLSEKGCRRVAGVLYKLFNFRFDHAPENPKTILNEAGIDPVDVPVEMWSGIEGLIHRLFHDQRLRPLLSRTHCLGNLLLVAAVSVNCADEQPIDEEPEALLGGLRLLAGLIGADAEAVMPCTVTPAHLKMLYGNGVLVSGEFKAGGARRGCPVDRVFVDSVGDPLVPPNVLASIQEADLILFAPGSLYTSIIPILQLPTISKAIRENRTALKFLVANLWVQKGETDIAVGSRERRFHVSDMIAAYHRNIPNGTDGLFNYVMVLGLQDIPGSVLRNYALEDKVPIYLDRDKVASLGFVPIECRIFSAEALSKHQVVQHDPYAMALAVRAVWAGRDCLPPQPEGRLTGRTGCGVMVGAIRHKPGLRYPAIHAALESREMDGAIREQVAEILWQHRDISLTQLANVDGIILIETTAWKHSQEWDRVFAYYDPTDRLIKIRQDIFNQNGKFELAFLVGLGESLLGNYAAEKQMAPFDGEHGMLGRLYRVRLRPEAERKCWLTGEELHSYLELARMNRSVMDAKCYTRLINGTEGFTPPGLLFGLVYAWYLDNRFAAHIEYKMAILQMEVPDMITEQVKVRERRRELVDFFRRVVFRYDAPEFEPDRD